VRLREQARSDSWSAARLLLKARGIPFSAEALAGAAIEADTMLMTQGFILGLAKGSRG
jgi:hypothetical protein